MGDPRLKLGTLAALVRGGQLPAALAANRSVPHVHRLAFLAAAGSSGVLARLAGGGATLDEIAAAIGDAAGAHDALEAWLAVGVRIGELAHGGARYRLRSRLAKSLARAEHDPVLAIIAQTMGLHARLILETPALLQRGQRFGMVDQDGAMVARASRITEPLIREAIDEVVPARGALHLLEVGCGAGDSVCYAALRNPELRALALELQPTVAARARENLQAAGLSARAEVRTCDVRDLAVAADFDLVMLHQNLYYFPLPERVALLERLRGCTRPGGRVLITSICRGGSALAAILNLWGHMTDGCGPLPDVEQLQEQLRSAGWRNPSARNLLPGDRFYRFVATT